MDAIGECAGVAGHRAVEDQRRSELGARGAKVLTCEQLPRERKEQRRRIGLQLAATRGAHDLVTPAAYEPQVAQQLVQLAEQRHVVLPVGWTEEIGAPPARPPLGYLPHERAVERSRLRERDAVGRLLQEPHGGSQRRACAVGIDARRLGRDEGYDRLDDRAALGVAARVPSPYPTLNALRAHHLEAASCGVCVRRLVQRGVGDLRLAAAESRRARRQPSVLDRLLERGRHLLAYPRLLKAHDAAPCEQLGVGWLYA